MYARIAAAAQGQTDSFYQNKLALAQYYSNKVLADFAARVQRVKSGTDVMMDFSAEYFTAQS